MGTRFARLLPPTCQTSASSGMAPRTFIRHVIYSTDNLEPLNQLLADINQTDALRMIPSHLHVSVVWNSGLFCCLGRQYHPPTGVEKPKQDNSAVRQYILEAFEKELNGDKVAYRHRHGCGLDQFVDWASYATEHPEKVHVLFINKTIFPHQNVDL